MIRKYILSFALLLLFFIISCKKKQVVDCPGFAESHLDWLPFNKGDTILYTDSVGHELIFTGVRKFATVYEQRICRATFPTPPCNCNNAPHAGTYAAMADSTWRKTNSAGQTLRIFNHAAVDIFGNEESGFTVSYQILDGTSNYHLNPDIELSGNDILLPSYTIGGQTYSQVVEHTVDTANNSYVNPGLNVNFIYKIYSNKTAGIIAFQDLKTNRFYYRKL